MVGHKRALERKLVEGRTRALVSVVSCGIILANLAVSSSAMLKDFALLSMTSIWLYAAAFVCGSVLGATLDEVGAIFYGVCLMALIAVLVFSGVLISPALLNRTPVLDLVLLVAFQQAFPRFISICVWGFAGTFFLALLKVFADRFR